ncbi:hypothetical protein RhiirC2_856854 [Rhizophagus irregularis]|uniref:Uncharacterized protein n=1 Tax=Rhizophagus irregularis TaxID=588596 RepID=A0A2N1MFL7_9GLOM|nr:hypothetical protein RhiirC2_856854 [Rhizophagus irregularis]
MAKATGSIVRGTLLYKEGTSTRQVKVGESNKFLKENKEISEDKESANVRQRERYVSPSRKHIEEDEHVVQGRTGKKLTGKSQMGEWYKIQQNCYRAKDEECEVQGLIQRLM